MLAKVDEGWRGLPDGRERVHAELEFACAKDCILCCVRHCILLYVARLLRRGSERYRGQGEGRLTLQS